MPIFGESIQELDFFPPSPPAIIGELTTGGTVTIELWIDGVAFTDITSNVCAEINGTGRYSWSTGNIETIDSSRVQFHFRMTDSVSSDTDEGDFILKTLEGRDGSMPSLRDPDSYIEVI